MPTVYLQANRSLSVASPLGSDTLLLVGLSGHEAISQPFCFRLDLLAENGTDVPFDRLLGQRMSATLALPNDRRRHFSGICARISVGERDELFTTYRAEIVPEFSFLTHKAQSRIFQTSTVPDILKKVLQGLRVEYQLKGQYEPRDYCVQYRETDFNFASRLMEEEGVFYYFRHTAQGHVMVVSDSPQGYPEMPEGSRVIFDEVSGGFRDEDRIHVWEKTQRLRSGKYTLWDHCFELPHKHLEAEQLIQDTLKAGEADHKLKIGRNEVLEIYDYPGGYAQRFDGVNAGGGDQASELQKIFQDNRRTVALRMQEEAASALAIHGAGYCRHFVSGHRFTLERHFHADGAYLLTSVQHTARLSGEYRSGSGSSLSYSNTFTCIPESLPFRPVRATPKPSVQGTQTAVVVGPPGEEIFTDKYGRVKVQFHWDREGKNDVNSSCWVRVGTSWAGKQWGMIQIPRIGQEVIVAFEEGDPDRPIILGSVFNAEMMPPFALPDGKVVSGIKSQTHKGAGYNELTFDDTAGKERITIHGQYDMNTTVKHDQTTTVHNNRTDKIDVDDSETVGSNQTVNIGSNQTMTIGSNQAVKIGADQNMEIGARQQLSVGSDQTESIGANRTINVATNDALNVAGKQTIDVTGPINISSDSSITLTVGGSTIEITTTGISLSSPKITIAGSAKVETKGTMITSQATGVNEMVGKTIKLN